MQILAETQFSKTLCHNLSRNKGGDDGLSPEQSGSQSIPTQPKPNAGRSAQRHRKPTDNGPKIKKLKYHQYISPDHKADKEPPPRLDSSSSCILQQQQLFLQLLILSQQQQSYSCHPNLEGPSRTQTYQLDEMKVADLRSELKLRSLPVYGTKIHLIERLRAYEEAGGGGGTSSSPPAGGTVRPEAEGAGGALTTAATSATAHRVSLCRQTHQSADARSRVHPLINVSARPSNNSSNPSRKRLSLQSCLAAQLPTASTTSLLTADKDEMLREKDEQIEELTRMLRQEQKLVEALKMQLERERTGGQDPDPLVLVRVRQEHPDEPSVARSCEHPPAPLCQVDIKQEAAEVLKFPELPQFLTQEAQEQIVPQIKLEHVNPKEATQDICLQRSTTPEKRQQGNVQGQQHNRPKCHTAHKPLTQSTKQTMLLINLKQQQVQMQKYPHVQQQQSRQLFPPLPIPPSCHLQSGLQSRVDATEQELSRRGSGRLEDFLESTTGKPLLGVEPGLVALIDDLHSQMLCSPSILDRPPSPVDSSDWSEVLRGVKSNDWLDLNTRGDTAEETQVPLGPQTPCGIFSTDCLDSMIL